MSYRGPTRPSAAPKRAGTTVRLAEPPDADGKAELVALVRAESRELAVHIEAARVRYDRRIRLAGAALTAVGLALALAAPLPTRAAALAGMALAGGPAAMFLGGRGAVDERHVPGWVGVVYAVAGLVGGLAGLALLG